MGEHLDHKHSQGLAGTLDLVLNTWNGIKLLAISIVWLKLFLLCRKSLKIPQAYSTGSDGIQLEWSVNFRKKRIPGHEINALMALGF